LNARQSAFPALSSPGRNAIMPPAIRVAAMAVSSARVSTTAQESGPSAFSKRRHTSARSANTNGLRPAAGTAVVVMVAAIVVATTTRFPPMMLSSRQRLTAFLRQRPAKCPLVRLNCRSRQCGLARLPNAHSAMTKQKHRRELPTDNGLQ
jgi:hypothetical protein